MDGARDPQMPRIKDEVCDGVVPSEWESFGSIFSFCRPYETDSCPPQIPALSAAANITTLKVKYYLYYKQRRHYDHDGGGGIKRLGLRFRSYTADTDSSRAHKSQPKVQTPKKMDRPKLDTSCLTDVDELAHFTGTRPC
ncbi:hypothetical protein B296_00010017 [Ensete ventricosum]|uniref:Uncharacterized protein n=1 Tax=Ensete ventricosum TaxID=4639 RepID=A0A427B276_ENSVE|nr:hypothetical protein B296_00010017 [Ensete ventricosum]